MIGRIRLIFHRLLSSPKQNILSVQNKMNEQQRRLLILALIILFVFATIGIIFGFFYFSTPRATTTPPVTQVPAEMCCSNNPIQICGLNQSCGPGGVCVESGISGVTCNTCETQGMIMLPDGSGCVSFDDYFNPPQVTTSSPPTTEGDPIVTRSTLAPNLFMYLPESVAGPARRN